MNKEAKTNIKLMVLMTIFLMSMFAIVKAAPTFTSTILHNGTDNFYRDGEVISFNFTVTETMFGNVTINCSNLGGDAVVNATNLTAYPGNVQYLASCTVNYTATTDVGACPYSLFKPLSIGNITITAVNATGSVATSGISGAVIPYNFTLPISNGSMNQFGSDTTNLQSVNDFSSVNYIIDFEMNLSAYGLGNDFVNISLFNFSSLDMTSPSIIEELASLPNYVVINISRNYTHPSYVYLDSAGLSSFNTTTILKIFNLPFTSTPSVIGDEGGSASLISYDATTGTLTFTANHFSTYNISDETDPLITLVSPVNGSTITTSSTLLTIDFNGTGSPISPSSSMITLKSPVTGTTILNYDKLAGCINQSAGEYLLNCTNSSVYTSLANGMHNITIYIEDEAENYEQITGSFYVDTTPPAYDMYNATNSTGDSTDIFNTGSNNLFIMYANWTSATLTSSNLTAVLLKNNTAVNTTTSIGGMTNLSYRFTTADIGDWIFTINVTDENGRNNITPGIVVDVAGIPNVTVSKTSTQLNYIHDFFFQFIINITNNGETSLTDVNINDIYDNNAMAYNSSSLAPTGNPMDGTVEINVSNQVGAIAVGQSYLVYINFSDAGATLPNVTTNSVVINATDSIGDEYVVVTDTASITTRRPNITVVKTLLNSGTILADSTVQFMINITNFDSAIINMSNMYLFDYYNTTYLNYSTSDVTPDTTDRTNGMIRWPFNITTATYLVYANFTALTNGNTTNNVTIIEVEGLGNTTHDTNVTAVTISPDTTPPSLNLVLPINSTNTTNNYMIFQFNATDSADTSLDCNLTIDGSVSVTGITVTQANPVNITTVTSISDGVHTWSVNCMDDNYNINTSVTRIFTVDTTSPTYDTADYAVHNISTTTPSNGNTIWFASNWTDASSSVASVSWYVGGSIVNSTTSVTDGTMVNLTWTIPSTYIGAYSTYILVNDTLGHTNQTSTITINVSDTTPPNPITLNSPSDASSSATDDITFQFTANDNYDSSFNCNLTIDGIVNVSGLSVTNATAKTQAVQNFTDGTHTWNVTCWDSYNNINTSATNTFTIDTVSPTYDTAFFAVHNISTTTPSNGNTIWFATNWTDSALNVASVAWYVDGSIVNSTTSVTDGTMVNLSWTIPSNYIGVYTTYVWANDTIGRSNQTTTLTINVSDATAPTPITLNSPASGANQSSDDVSFQFTANDNYDSSFNCNLTIDGIVNVSGLSVTNATAKTQAVQNFTDGTHTWNVTCWDSYSNDATSSTSSFTIDTTSPVIGIVNMTDDYVQTETAVLVTVQATDATTGVLSVTAEGQSLISAGGNLYWGNVTLSSSPLNIIATDYVSNSASNNTLIYTLDNTAPTIPAATLLADGLQLSTASSTAPQVTNADGNVTINWTVYEQNISSTNVSVDSAAIVQSNSTNGTLSLITTVEAGLHTVVFASTDSADNKVTTSTYYFTMNAQENTTELLDTFNTSAGDSVSEITLTDSAGSDMSNNQTFLNATYDLTLNTSTESGITVPVVIENFNGLDANWNQTFVVNTSDTSVNSTIVLNYGTSTFDMIIFNDMSDFLSDDSYYANISLSYDIGDLGLEVYYIADDTASSTYEMAACSGAISNSMTTACYVIDDTNNITNLYLPHFSGAVVTNDSIAPVINMTTPLNGSTVNTTTAISGTIKESAGLAACNYSIDTSALNLTLSTSGTAPDFTFSIASAAYSNASHNISIRCVDSSNNSNTGTESFYWTAADITAPTITTSSPSGALASSTTSATLSVTLDELASVCRYATSSSTNLSSMSSSNTLTLSSGTTYTKSVSVSAGNSYTYYVRCNDTIGNTMNTSETITFSVTSASSTPASSGGGGGGGAATTTGDTYEGKTSRAWASIDAGSAAIMPVNKASIPVSKVTLNVVNTVSNSEVSVGAISGTPSGASALSGAKIFKYLKIDTKNLADSDLESVVIAFKVEKDWLSSNGFSDDEVALYRYSSNVWQELPTVKTGSDETEVMYDATTPGLSYFAIAVKSVGSSAFELLDTIRTFYEGNSSLTAFDIIDKIRAFYGG